MNDITSPARYAADLDRVYSTTEMTIQIDCVQIGDMRGDRVVASIKNGRLNTELLDADGKRVDYSRNETPILVTRKHETNESVLARQHQRSNFKLAEMLQDRSAGVKAAQAKLNEQLDSLGGADYNRYSNLMAAQSELGVLNDFASYATLTNEDGTNRFNDLVEALVKFSAYLTEQLVRSGRNRALSRSTSVLSNLLEDCEGEAMARFLDQTRWYF